jgi:hypothetical protein
MKSQKKSLHPISRSSTPNCVAYLKKNNSLNCEGEEEEKEGSAHHSKQNKMFEVFDSEIM